MKMDESKNDEKKVSSPLVREEPVNVKSVDENHDGKVFQDVMDWNVISDEAGKCPLCGMKLKEVSLEKAEKNLIENDFILK